MENDSTKIDEVYNAKVVLIKEECRVLKEEITSKFNSFETAVASGAIKHEQECEETIAFITGNVASIIEAKEKDLTYVQAIMKVVKYGYAMFDLFVGSVDDSKDVSEKLALTLRADDAFDVLHVETEYVLSWYVKRFYQQSRKITTKSESIVK